MTVKNEENAPFISYIGKDGKKFIDVYEYLSQLIRNKCNKELLTEASRIFTEYGIKIFNMSSRTCFIEHGQIKCSVLDNLGYTLIEVIIYGKNFDIWINGMNVEVDDNPHFRINVFELRSPLQSLDAESVKMGCKASNIVTKTAYDNDKAGNETISTRIAQYDKHGRRYSYQCKNH